MAFEGAWVSTNTSPTANKAFPVFVGKWNYDPPSEQVCKGSGSVSAKLEKVGCILTLADNASQKMATVDVVWGCDNILRVPNADGGPSFAFPAHHIT